MRPQDGEFSLFVRAYWPDAAITRRQWTPLGGDTIIIDCEKVENRFPLLYDSTRRRLRAGYSWTAVLTTKIAYYRTTESSSTSFRRSTPFRRSRVTSHLAPHHIHYPGSPTA